MVEIPRTPALKLMATNAAAKREITRIATERQLLQMFGPARRPRTCKEVLASAEIQEVRAGQTIIEEGDEGYDIFVIRQGSMVVEKSDRRQAGLPLLSSGRLLCRRDGADRRRPAHRDGARRDQVRSDQAGRRRLPPPARRASPTCSAASSRTCRRAQELNSFIEAKKDSFGGVVDMYSSVAGFLVENGIGEATDVLLIDEKLCIGCDNCERACADSHEGLSRLDREAGRTYAHLHVPTSCRHCEHPHCMADCPPNAINRGPDGEVYINDTCIGCGNCQRNCPYGVIRMAKPPPQEAEPVEMAVLWHRPGAGRAGQEMDRRQGQLGNAQKGDQMRHVFGDRRRAGLRARLPDRRGDPRLAGRVPDRGQDGARRLS